VQNEMRRSQRECSLTVGQVTHSTPPPFFPATNTPNTTTAPSRTTNNVMRTLNHNGSQFIVISSEI
jgi:hypothetical protein